MKHRITGNFRGKIFPNFEVLWLYQRQVFSAKFGDTASLAGSWRLASVNRGACTDRMLLQLLIMSDLTNSESLASSQFPKSFTSADYCGYRASCLTCMWFWKARINLRRHPRDLAAPPSNRRESYFSPVRESFFPRKFSDIVIRYTFTYVSCYYAVCGVVCYKKD